MNDHDLSLRLQRAHEIGINEGYAQAIEDAVKAVKALAEESEAISFQAPLVMVISRLEALSRGSR